MAGTIASLAESLLSGGENFITRMVQEKIEDLGRDLIADIVGSVVPGGNVVVARITQAIATGGESGFGHMRSGWLGAVQSSLLSVSKATDAYSRAERREERRFRTPWGRSDWATSRRDWLDNRWQHDWRSQPRDPRTGRWLPGRLEYAAAPSLQTPGKRVGRTVRRWRAVRRRRRAIARRAAREGFNDND